MMTDRSIAPRRWFQFRLRTLLIAVLLLSLPLSWFAMRMEKARRQKEAVEWVERTGGIVIYDWAWKESRGYMDGARKDSFSRLRTILGDDFFDQVECVLAAESAVSDDVLKYVGNLTSLDVLVLAHTGTTDTGLSHLTELIEFNDVDLTDTRITDLGLLHLERFHRLEALYLADTQITDSGLRHLRALTNLQTLRLDRTHITNAGLQYLTGLTNLTELSLQETRVTPEGVKKLREALPDCKIEHSHLVGSATVDAAHD